MSSRVAQVSNERPVRPGDVIADKYSVVSVLGEGGMGYVVAARHLALGQLVAIKLLLPMSLRSEEAIARFLREARAVVALTSDHVARILDFGTTNDGFPFIVMEHLAGETLATLSERGPMPASDAIGFMLDVGDALTEAHSLGIVHRDLKPENVFVVQKANGKRYAKVLDFGVSRIDNPEIAGGMRALTATGAAIGTPAFMAPEQISPKKPPGPKVDVWALGATLYCALTARLPFESDSVYELPVKIHGEPPTPITNHRSDLPEGLVSVISDCLTKDPDARPTLAEILSRLEAVRANPNAPAKPVKPAVLVTELAPTQRIPLDVPITGETLALPGAPSQNTALLRTASPLTRTPLTNAAHRGPPQTAIFIAAAGVFAVIGVIAIAFALHRRAENASAAAPLTREPAATMPTATAATTMTATMTATPAPTPTPTPVANVDPLDPRPTAVIPPPPVKEPKARKPRATVVDAGSAPAAVPLTNER